MKNILFLFLCASFSTFAQTNSSSMIQYAHNVAEENVPIYYQEIAKTEPSVNILMKSIDNICTASDYFRSYVNPFDKEFTEAQSLVHLNVVAISNFLSVAMEYNIVKNKIVSVKLQEYCDQLLENAEWMKKMLQLNSEINFLWGAFTEEDVYAVYGVYSFTHYLITNEKQDLKYLEKRAGDRSILKKILAEHYTRWLSIF